jgi:hypothetical protein
LKRVANYVAWGAFPLSLRTSIEKLEAAMGPILRD